MVRFGSCYFLFLAVAVSLASRSHGSPRAVGVNSFGRANAANDAHQRVVWWRLEPCRRRRSDTDLPSAGECYFLSGWGNGEPQGAVPISVSGASRLDATDVAPIKSQSSDGRGRSTTATCTEARGRPRPSDAPEAVAASVRTGSERRLPGISKLGPPRIRRRKSPEREFEKEPTHGADGGTNDGAAAEEPSPSVLESATRPLIPRSTWDALTGREFFSPSCLPMLARTGIRTATRSDDIISWRPNKHTHKLIDEEEAGTAGGGDGALRGALSRGEILVWTGRFKSDGYGSDLPLVKTMWTLDMEPRAFAELLMDSSRVKSYNKMSLGRSDVVTFQDGIDAASEKYGRGEAKIVRNLTKPPLSKRNMEFVTLMHARRMGESDDAGVGVMGGGADDGYVVVSRAVGGSGWAGGLPSCVRAGGSSGDDEFIRSEILLGVNVIRAVPGQPGKSEVTAVTHCNSPSVPRALAGKVGVKGAVDFVKDVRSLCK